MARKTDTTEVKFFITADEKGNFGVDTNIESARDELFGKDDLGDCMDVYEVTVSVPKAKTKRVHLGTVARSEDGASITVESVEAA